MNATAKLEAIKAMDTAALRRIDEATGPTSRPTHDAPLRGMIRIDGIGNIPIGVIRDELKTR